MKGTCKKMKWIERNMNRIKRTLITGNCTKHTHTDKRKVKGAMKGMKAKRKGKNNARKMTANKRNVKRTWKPVICMGNGTTCSESEGLITYVVTNVTKTFLSLYHEVECGPYIQILNSWPNHTNLCFGAFSEGFCIQAMVAGCCGFCCVLAVCG